MDSLESFLNQLGDFLLEKDLTSVKKCLESQSPNIDIPNQLCIYILDILEGRHVSVVAAAPNFCSLTATTTAEDIRKEVLKFLGIDQTQSDVVITREQFLCNLFHCLLLGVAYFELFCQANYTGPELSSQHMSIIIPSSSSASFSLEQLECDGCYAFSICEIPQTLLIARVLLSTISDPSRCLWQRGIIINEEGKVERQRDVSFNFQKYMNDHRLLDTSLLPCRFWWCARSSVTHYRLLQSQSYSDCPSLHRESVDMFLATIYRYGYSKETQEQVNQPALIEEAIKTISESLSPTPSNEGGVNVSVFLQVQLWLEIGLSRHHFSQGDRGKICFGVARQVSGLVTELSAAMGKRTKHQHSEYAQLFLFAKSKLLSIDNQQQQQIEEKSETNESSSDSKEKLILLQRPGQGQGQVIKDGEKEKEEEGGWKHADWELGRRLVGEVQGGEEAAVREVLLDSMDGGEEVNIVLEGGPRFSDKEVDKGGSLHALDQAVVLALCLDVGNSNPSDGLTQEEMSPYIERVLQQANNWMIHSTALLERSWLEFERRKTADRAMLQIQALIDQHSTKLTITQSTRKVIEESAPAQDRLRYLHSLNYLSQVELKRDLAFKYLRCQVFASALNYFKELELWDEVVTCYQLMQKPQRAELVVREQLKSGETPYMLTALADLTQKEEFYEKAWQLSKGRYPRAKRTLAKICHDRGQFLECCQYLDQALAVQPLVATAWYLKGIACMRIERWEEGIQAFVRCVQQDMEIGEAWANIGAIHMKMKSWAKAYPALTEALKHKRENWKIIENLMIVGLAIGRWREVVMHMNKLLDLRLKSQRPYHIDELRHLAYIVSNKTQREGRLNQPKEEKREVVQKVVNDEEEEDEDEDLLCIDPLPEPALSVEQLIIRITNTVKSDPEVWEVLADFQHTLGRFPQELDARIKQFRAFVTTPNWEKDESKVTAVEAAAKQLVKTHCHERVQKTELYSCKTLLQTALRQLQATNNAKISEQIQLISEYIIKIENYYNNR